MSKRRVERNWCGNAKIIKIKLLKEEGSQVSAKCGHLKMKAEDGKMRLIDVADTEVTTLW
ncbi:MAG: hypothetical protein LBD17_04225 [Endomicrobium sp.]|nr:hypothetical protein [Endomicrobium sp.]